MDHCYRLGSFRTLKWFLSLCSSKDASTLILSRLVDKINVSIGQDPNSKCLIGILDIYGFESFKANR